jgi:hypothetical protein
LLGSVLCINFQLRDSAASYDKFANMWGHKSLVYVIVLIAATAFSSPHNAKPQSGAKTATPTPDVRRIKGVVEKGTYKNPFIGIEFTPAADLHFQEPKVAGAPGTALFIVSVEALADRGLSNLFWARSLTLFYADSLTHYPEEQRTAARHLKKVIRANESNGFQQVDGETSGQISGITFLRADLVKKEVHEAILVTTHNDYAFAFWFAGSDLIVINKLIASTKVKLSPPLDQNTTP